MAKIDYDGRVIIVTGAGRGMGAAHAKELAKRGARVVVNDYGGDMHGSGSSSTPAREVAEEITAAGGSALANGDTVHPSSVEEVLMHAQGTADLVLALDQHKLLGQEEMEVHVTEEGLLDRINKALDPASAQGEYIGVTLIEPEAAADLADALRVTYERDPQLYYEDGYQELADRGITLSTAPIGEVSWVEIDNHDDLARGREIACHY